MRSTNRSTGFWLWVSVGVGGLALVVGVSELLDGSVEGLFPAGFGAAVLIGEIPTNEVWQKARLDSVEQGGSLCPALIYRGSPQNTWADALLWLSVIATGVGAAFYTASDRPEVLLKVVGWVALIGGSIGLVTRLRSMNRGVSVAVTAYGITCESRRLRETVPWDAVTSLEYKEFEVYHGAKLGSIAWFGIKVSDLRRIQRSAWDRVLATLQLRSAWRGVAVMCPIPLEQPQLEREIRAVVQAANDDPRKAGVIDTAVSADGAISSLLSQAE